MATPFVGNQDYRGYLNYLSKQGDKAAQNLIGSNGNYGFVNNQGQLSNMGVISPDLISANTRFLSQYNNLNGPGPLPGYGGGGGTPTVYAPKLDVASVNAKARAAAEGAVNPYYTSLLNKFLKEQAYNKQQRQTQYETNISNLDETLKNQLEQGNIDQARTTEDVAQNQADIAQNADQFQTDTGQEFDQARLELARQASTGGLGSQKTEGATQQRNVAESRQVQKFQQAKEQQQLFKSRTFEDIARSGKLAGEKTAAGKKQEKFDLDNYIQQQKFDETNKRDVLEESRQEKITLTAAKNAQDAYNRYIQGIANPAQRLAAAQQYGGSF